MATMNDTSLLFNTTAEREIISACIFDENIYTSVKEMLNDDLFVDAGTKQILSIIHDMENDGKKPEFSEIAMRYASKGGNITEFMSDVPYSFVATKQRIEQLQELLIKRKLYELCTKGLQMAVSPAANSDDFQTLLSDFSQTAKDNDSSIMSFKDSVISLQNAVADRMNGVGERGIMTGLHVFDVRTGWHPGDLVILAGRTSQGKTSCALTIAGNMAMDGVPSVFYSMEMGADKLTARITARYSSIASSRILYERMNDGEYKKFYDTSSYISELPIYFDERNKTSFQKICNSIRAMVRKHNIKIAFIDYLQMFANSSQNANREQLIGDMARELKNVAVECNICICALSQLSRNPQSPEPTISELRGSGQIEEAADMVVLVYRPSVYGIERWPDGKLTQGTARIEIGKGRNVGLAKEIVSFNGELTFFEDYVEKAEEPVKEVMPWQKDVKEENLPF